MPSTKIYQPSRDNHWNQEPLASYALGTQESTWPEAFQRERLETSGPTDKETTGVESWDVDQSSGVSDSARDLRSLLRMALASLDTIVNHPRQKLQIIAEEQQQTQQQQNQSAIALLRSWRHGDEQEQQETLAYLKHALDEDRLSDRKLFS